MSIETREFRPGDEDQLLALFKNVFGLEPDRAEWEWRFLKHPMKSQFIRVAEDTRSKAIVAQYALIPTQVQVGQEVVPAALSLHTMVDARYRGQGLFTRLAKELFDSPECRQRVQVLIGFPNENSYPGFVGKLGWTHVGNCPLLIRPFLFVQTVCKLNARWGTNLLVRLLLRLLEPMYRLLFPIHKPTGVTPLKRFDASFDRLFGKASYRMASCRIYKDAAYMNWRYAECPHIPYEIFQLREANELRGIVVVSRVDSRGAIVDLIAADDKSERQLLDFANSHFRDCGVAYVLTVCPPQSRLHREFRRRGYLTAKQWPFIIRQLGGRSRPEVEIQSNWHLMPGDNDTF